MDIVGIAETHLKKEQTLTVPGYIWFGHNRQEQHHRAQTGSGGVGFLVKDDIMNDFKIAVKDASTEGILWIEVRSKTSEFCFNMCVCYLPPVDSSRHIDPHDFFETLLSQVYCFQQNGPFLICGDFNSRLGKNTDFIEGVDDITQRQILDTTENTYGQICCDFLVSANCCVLNGRNNKQNDFTSFNHRGQSVVDYGIVPYELLDAVSSFEIIRPRTLFNKAGGVSLVDPSHGIPDHAMLQWTVDLSHLGYQPENHHPGTADRHRKTTTVSYVKYNTRNVPQDFMINAQIQEQIHELIQKLEQEQVVQDDMNEIYKQFCDSVSSEMDDKLQKRTILLKSGLSNKRRKFKKKWWSDELTDLWNNLCEAEEQWRRASQREKEHMKANMKSHQKIFDRKVQSAKRCFWKDEQQRLLNMYTGDTKNFWKKIGQIGAGSERSKDIPIEIIQEDGTTSKDPTVVLEKWKHEYHNLLNP